MRRLLVGLRKPELAIGLLLRNVRSPSFKQLLPVTLFGVLQKIIGYHQYDASPAGRELPPMALVAFGNPKLHGFGDEIIDRGHLAGAPDGFRCSEASCVFRREHHREAMSSRDGLASIADRHPHGRF